METETASKRGVTYHEVASAANQRVRNAKSVSADLIRRDLGDRGSKSTILKHLNEWRNRLPESSLDSLPPRLPQELVEPMEILWDRAVQEAEAGLEVHRKKVDEENESLRGERDEALTNAANVNQENEKLRSRLEALETDNKRLEAQLGDSQDAVRSRDSRIESLELKVANLEQRCSDLSDKAREEKERLEHEADQRVEQERNEGNRRIEHLQGEWAREREQLQQRVDNAEARAAQESERTDRQIDYWINQVEVERSNVKQCREQAEQDKQRLRSDLDVVQRKNEKLSGQVESLQERLEAAHEKIDAQYETIMSGMQAPGPDSDQSE